MSARLDKNKLDSVEKRIGSLSTIKKAIEDFGGTCNVNWETETINIDVPPGREFECIRLIEGALRKNNYSNQYNIGEEVFVDDFNLNLNTVL